MESRELVQMSLSVLESNSVLNIDGKAKERERGRVQKLSLSRQERAEEGAGLCWEQGRFFPSNNK